jgi:sporulation protein YlmC with PRC-barrel domain
MEAHIYSTSKLTGAEVLNPKGEKLGDIKDVMLDLESGHIAYAVLSFGGFLGFNDKYFAIPWGGIMVDVRNQRILVDVNKELLEKAPGFDKDNWPEQPDKAFVSEVHAYYGYRPYWEGEQVYEVDRFPDKERVIGSDRLKS